MKNLVIGVTFSLVSTFTLILLVLTFQEGDVFVFKDMWSSFVARISTLDFLTKEVFDNLMDSFSDIKDFELPSLSDGVFEAIKSVFNLLGDLASAIINLIALLIVPVYDLTAIIGELILSIGKGWERPKLSTL